MSTPKSPLSDQPSALFTPFKDIVRIQLTVNNTMAGENWITEAIEAQRIDYSWAALDESAELWRCAIPFKFWDRTEFVMDTENAKMEVVDLLHFAIAQDLASVNHGEAPETSEVLVEMVAARMDKGSSWSESEGDPQKNLRLNLKAFIHGLTHPSGTQIDWTALFNLAHAVDLTPESLIALYKAKAILNKFRTQMRANGKYHKVWLESKEDNYYLTQWLSTQPAMPPEADVMNWLVSTYRRMIPQ